MREPDWFDVPPASARHVMTSDEPLLHLYDYGYNRWQAIRIAHAYNDWETPFEDVPLSELRAVRKEFLWNARNVTEEWMDLRRDEGFDPSYPESIHDIWDEWGVYCPWYEVPRGTEGAHRWWMVWA